MALRKYTNPRELDLSPGLQDVLRRNGMQAHMSGSILNVEGKDYHALLDFVQNLHENSTLDLSMAAWLGEVTDRLPVLVEQACIMGQKYDVVVTNPPYMGIGNMNPILSKFLKKEHPDSKSDLSTVFMERTLFMCKEYGYMSMINIPVWMFIFLASNSCCRSSPY